VAVAPVSERLIRNEQAAAQHWEEWAVQYGDRPPASWVGTREAGEVWLKGAQRAGARLVTRSVSVYRGEWRKVEQ
jgi:hypothetical protein